jgi:ABC-type xylose transport system substrate-binding protein
MAMTQTKSVTAIGPSAWMLINLNSFNYGVGLIANLSTGGTATYSIEVTGQDPKLPGFGTIVNGMDNMVNLNTSKNGSLAYPCTAVRINVASIAVGTTVSLSVVQGVD